VPPVGRGRDPGRGGDVAVPDRGGGQVLGVDRRVVVGALVVAQGVGHGYQPRSIHSWRWGISVAGVVGSPWPGSTRVSPGSVNRRSSIERMMVGKSPPGKLVLPGPPGNSVSPLNRTGAPSTRKHIEPGVCPGVRMVCSRSRPTSI